MAIAFPFFHHNDLEFLRREAAVKTSVELNRWVSGSLRVSWNLNDGSLGCLAGMLILFEPLGNE
jgi:hypothetical protein